MTTLLTLVMALLVITVVIYLFYTFFVQLPGNIQKKPLIGPLGNGHNDTEFAEEPTFNGKVKGYEFRLSPLPKYYGENRLVLMVKDPEWLFAYWEITNEIEKNFTKINGERAWGESKGVLRIYNLTKGDHFDIPINDQADNWYIKVGQPNTRFRAEIGRIFQGKYFDLIRSKEITTPALGFSQEIDPAWPPNPAIWQSLSGAVKPVFGSCHLTNQEH